MEADRVERRERRRAGDLSKATKGGQQLPDGHAVHEHLWKKLEKGVSVWIVNGRQVRSVFDIDFTEGGHDHVYEFVPEGEVWIDDAITEPERGYVLLHSGGMKQRVGIAQALLNDPQLLIVDEPTAGLDPEERVRFRNLLSELSGERIIILSTHIVSDVEATATDIALISQGALVAHASPEELLRRVEDKVWEWVIPSADLNGARQRHLISNTARRSDGVHARVLGETPPDGAQPATANLEDAYLFCLTQHRAGTVSPGVEAGVVA